MSIVKLQDVPPMEDTALFNFLVQLKSTLELLETEVENNKQAIAAS